MHCKLCFDVYIGDHQLTYHKEYEIQSNASRFPSWRDSKNVNGLTFLTPEDANAFGQWIQFAIDSIGRWSCSLLLPILSLRFVTGNFQ